MPEMDVGMTVGLIKALGSPDPAVIEGAVSDWLDDHPEATTTVEDGAISYAKLDSSLKGTVDDVGDLKTDINALEPSASESDVGKALIAKIVSGGKVTEYEFGEAGSAPNILYPIPGSGGRDPGYVDIDTGVPWEAGSINTTTGEPTDSTYYIRSSNFISFDPSITKIHVAYASDDITATIIWYNSSYERTATSGSIDSIVPYDFDNPVAANRIYWKIILRYKQGTGKTPDATLPTLLKIQYYDAGSPAVQTDRTEEIESILTEYGECILSKGDFYVTGIDMPVGTKIRGQGASTSLYLMASVTDGAAITPLGDNTISDMSILRENGYDSRPSETTPATDFGITCANNVNLIRIDNCDIKGFSGAGLYGYGQSQNDAQSAVISNCRFLYNTVGIWFDGGMEFNSVVNCVCNSNYYGVRNEGGNNVFSNSHFDSNVCGFTQMASGVTPQNFGHGSVVGCTLNHNTSYSVYFRAGANGMMFIGCQLWYGTIYLRSITAIVFDGCEIGGTTVPITFYGSACAGNRFMDCSFSIQPTVSLENSATTASYIIKDCYLFDGTAVVFA